MGVEHGADEERPTPVELVWLTSMIKVNIDLGLHVLYGACPVGFMYKPLGEIRKDLKRPVALEALTAVSRPATATWPHEKTKNMSSSDEFLLKPTRGKQSKATGG